MKRKYYLFLIVLFSILAILIVVLKGYLELSNWITASATLGASFAALATGVIALGVADKPLRFVKFTVKTEVDPQNIEEYNPADLPDELKRGSDNNLFHSYRVYFKIKNQSGFTLKRPVITFRLPTDLTPPHKTNDDKWILSYRSNLYNVQVDLRSFQYEDTIVLSNTIVPYLNDDQEHPIWIRMCLLKDDTKCRSVHIDVNCDNAEGATEEVKIIAKKLLESISDR